MPKLVCVNCETELKPEVNGVVVVETMLVREPYKLWRADLWKCPGCGFEVVAGFGNRPTAEHFEEGFSEKLTREIVIAGRVVYDHERPPEKLKETAR